MSASGQNSKSIGFIAPKGLVRSFYIDENGDEITCPAFMQKEICNSFLLFCIKQQRLKYAFIHCLEDTTLVCLSLEGMNWIYEQSPNF